MLSPNRKNVSVMRRHSVYYGNRTLQDGWLSKVLSKTVTCTRHQSVLRVSICSSIDRIKLYQWMGHGYGWPRRMIIVIVVKPKRFIAERGGGHRN